MRTEARFLLFSGTFGLVVAIVYWFTSYEEAGAVLLALMGTASSFMGLYLVAKGRRLARAEDDPDADHEAEAGETVGYFSAGSLWPPVMALGAAMGVMGFIFGAWLLFFGAVLFGWAVVALMQESRG